MHKTYTLGTFSDYPFLKHLPSYPLLQRITTPSSLSVSASTFSIVKELSLDVDFVIPPKKNSNTACKEANCSKNKMFLFHLRLYTKFYANIWKKKIQHEKNKKN